GARHGTRPPNAPQGQDQLRPAGEKVEEGQQHLDDPQRTVHADLLGPAASAGDSAGRAYPPAIAPTTRKGSVPTTTASGSGVSGESWDRSSSQAKNRKNGRRWWVTWSRIVPRSIG